MKQKIKNLIASILLTLTASYSVAATSNVCADDYKVLTNQTQIQMGTLTANLCYLSIDPFNNLDLVFRSYIMATDSSIMIFNSYGDGPPETTTGARELFFFPRMQTLNYSTDATNLNVEMSGMNFTMDIASTKFTKIDGVEFQEAATIAKTNNGGFAITSSQRLYLDLGFRMGAAPRSNSAAKSVFHDAHGSVCEVANTDVFDYKTDVDNPTFKFTNDKDLAVYLKVRCANLDISSL